MKNSLQKIPFLVSVILLLASSFLLLFLYMQINKNNTKAEEMLNTWNIEAGRRQEIKSLEQSLKNLEGEKTELEKHFAQNSDIVPFLDTVESLAKTVGAEPEVQSVEAPTGTNYLLVNMKAKGSFEAVYKFLMLLENSPYQIEFDSVDMMRGGADNTQSKSWDMMLKLKLLSFVK